MALPTTNIKLKTVADRIGCDETLKTCHQNSNIYGFDVSYAGIQCPQFTNLDLLDTVDSFSLPRPPYNLGSFRNYKHGFKPAIEDIIVPSYSPAGGTNKASFSIDSGGLLSDMSLKDNYIGLGFIRQSDGRGFAYTLETKVNELLGPTKYFDVGEASQEMYYQIKDNIMVPEYLPNGQYNVYFILSSMPVNSIEYNSVFRKLTSDPKELLREVAPYAIFINIIASYVPSTRRYTYSVQVLNTGAYKCYLTYNIDIINNLDQSVWQHLAGPATEGINVNSSIQPASGDGTQVGMTSRSVKLQWELRATQYGSVIDSGIEIKPFKNV